MGGKYKLSYMTPEGEVNSTYMTKEGLAVAREHVIKTYGTSSIKEVSGPDVNEEKQLLTEAK